MVRTCLSWCRHLILALVVLALLGCLTEVGLRVYDSATGQVTRRDLYDRGMVGKSWSVHHGLKPSHTFSVRNPEGGERIAVAINSLGLRGGEPTIPKPPGVFRILCLGDETTFAPNTPEEETFSARLEQEIPAPHGGRVEVLNAGVPEYCPLLSYLQFKHQLLGLAPDLVIFHFDMSDVSDDYRYRRHAIIAAGGTPVSCAHPALSMRDSVKEAGARPRGDVLLLPVWCRQRLSAFWASHAHDEKSPAIDGPHSRYLWLEDEPPDWSVHIEQAFSPLAHLRDLAAGFGAHVVVVAAPAPWQVSAQASAGEGVRARVGVPAEACYRSRRPFELLAEYCRAQQLEFCDLSPAFLRSEEPSRLYLTNAAALSEDGHALYARELALFLERESKGRSALWPTRGGTGESRILPQARVTGR
jgi:hypothetical protein